MSIAGFAIAVLGLIGLWQANGLFATGWLGMAIQAIGALLMLWARFTFGRRSFHAAAEPTPGGVVTTGPYRLVRHPIYAAILYITWAGALSHPRLLTIACALVVTAGLALRMREEERLMTAEYPEYAAYAARTWRVIPGGLVTPRA
jgi:protein-S-isoprenylcysteine O-methyltransferase Ste14